MTEPLTLVPGRLHRLGGVAPLDGRISWARPDATGHEPIGCYLLTEGDEATLVDTGVALHSAEVVRQLGMLIPRGSTLRVFLTRLEPDCLSGLGGILDAFHVPELTAGGAANAFDFFDDINTADVVEAHYRVRPTRLLPGATFAVGGGRTLEILRTPLRLLSTFWLFDPATGTLFTSDAFSHVGLAQPTLPALVDAGTDRTDLATVRAHLVTKFEFLVGGRLDSIRDGLERIFSERVVERIAPVHGCVIEGRATVERHLELVLSVLEAIDGRNAHAGARATA